MSKIDDVRDYWNRRPCNIRHSPEPVGTSKFFDEVTARKYFVEPHIPGFADFQIYAGKKVLEIGCGIGTDTEMFARAGASVVAVDLSDESVILARRRLELRGMSSQADFVVGNAEELDRYVERQQFDLVYSFGVLHHTPNPSNAFAQLKKYLGPESEVKIMVYHRLSTKVFALVMKFGWPRFWRIDEAVAKQSEAEFGCPTTFTYTRRSISKLLRKSGLEVVSTSVDHIFPYEVSSYRAYSYRRRWYWSFMPASMFRWLERTLGWHLLVTARLPRE